MVNVHELGLQLQFIIVPLVFLVSGILGFLFLLAWRHSWLTAPLTSYGSWHWSTTVFSFIAWTLVSVSVIVGISWIFIGVPWNAKYWPYYSVTGTIENISNSLTADGDVTYKTYVVTFEGDETPYLLTDARVTALNGQKVELNCTLNWVEWGYSADQWECDIRSAAYTKTTNE